MALRGWRLIGVCGTISVYVTGILLLSLMSVNHPQTRRSVRGRVFHETDSLRHHELGIINRKPPLKWCTTLQYLDTYKKTIPPQTETFIQRLQTFPGHYVTKTKQNSHYFSHSIHRLGKNTNSQRLMSGVKKSPMETIAPVTPTFSRYDDSYKTRNQVNEYSNTNKKAHNDDNEVYHLVTQKWPSNKENPNSDNDQGLTALVSFPGSGNTWLRYLLQQATGILTGSVYKDYGLLKSGFPAENVANSSVLVVKTHEWGPQAWKQFSKAILLVRDPKKSILAEFNRQSGGHIGFASPDRYKRTKGKYWNQFVTNKLWTWEQTNLAWKLNFTGELLIVFYDQLVDDVEGTLRDILKFLNFPIIEELMQCALLRQEGIYRRRKRIFDPYTPAMHAVIDQKRTEVYEALGRKT